MDIQERPTHPLEERRPPLVLADRVNRAPISQERPPIAVASGEANAARPRARTGDGRVAGVKDAGPASSPRGPRAGASGSATWPVSNGAGPAVAAVGGEGASTGIQSQASSDWRPRESRCTRRGCGLADRYARRVEHMPAPVGEEGDARLRERRGFPAHRRVGSEHGVPALLERDAPSGETGDRSPRARVVHVNARADTEHAGRVNAPPLPRLTRVEDDVGGGPLVGRGTIERDPVVRVRAHDRQARRDGRIDVERDRHARRILGFDREDRGLVVRRDPLPIHDVRRDVRGAPASAPSSWNGPTPDDGRLWPLDALVPERRARGERRARERSEARPGAHR